MRRYEWAPTQWAVTTFALAGIHLQIGDVLKQAGPLLLADQLYLQASASFPKDELKTLLYNRQIIIDLFIRCNLHYSMGEYDQLLFSVERLFEDQQLPRDEWKRAWADIAAQWGVAPQPAGPPAPAEAQAAAKLILPERAPKLYAERPKGQSIIDFLRDPEGWGPYVAQGTLSRPDLGRFDPQAYRALAQWLHFNKVLPPDLRIPTKSEALPKAFETPEAVKAAARMAKRAYRQRIANL
jgi:tetratricopeptide (TPR) repeat protein